MIESNKLKSQCAFKSEPNLFNLENGLDYKRYISQQRELLEKIYNQQKKLKQYRFDGEYLNVEKSSSTSTAPTASTLLNSFNDDEPSRKTNSKLLIKNIYSSKDIKNLLSNPNRNVNFVNRKLPRYNQTAQQPLLSSIPSTLLSPSPSPSPSPTPTSIVKSSYLQFQSTPPPPPPPQIINTLTQSNFSYNVSNTDSSSRAEISNLNNLVNSYSPSSNCCKKINFAQFVFIFIRIFFFI